MAVDKTSTGIFTNIKISGPMGDRERKELENLLASTSIEDRIRFYEVAALQILSQRRSDSELRSDARIVLSAAIRLKRALLQDNVKEAAIHALDLGEIGTRMLVRPYERPAVAGRKSLATLAKGRRATGRYDAAKRRRREWIRYYQTLKADLSQRRRCELVAKHFNDKRSSDDPEVTPGAVKKAVQQLIPPKK
jgi:hypothetical protein